MRHVLYADADAAIRQLTDGLLRLETDETGVFLVNDYKCRRVQILRYAAADSFVDDRFEKVAALSQRELSVFAMLGEGLDMTQIARRMMLSVKTIETYRARIKQKLNIDHRTQLLAMAVEWRLNGGANGSNGKPPPDGETNATSAQCESR